MAGPLKVGGQMKALLLFIILISCKDHSSIQLHVHTDDHQHYSCPMGFDFVSHHAGICPICGQQLIKGRGV